MAVIHLLLMVLFSSSIFLPLYLHATERRKMLEMCSAIFYTRSRSHIYGFKIWTSYYVDDYVFYPENVAFLKWLKKKKILF